MNSFEELRRLLAQRIGLQLKRRDQQNSISRFIATRMKQFNLVTEQDYVSFLAKQPLQSDEFSRLISVVTNPHTCFFRDLDQFRAMRSLLEHRRQAANSALTIWSAGCATGEEPYSLALLCADLSLKVRILATDINRDVLLLAQKARYKAWSLRYLPAVFRERFFTKDGDDFCLCAGVRDCIEFKLHNLVEDAYHPPSLARARWDWILCRNVMIYFDRSTIAQIVDKFAATLDPQGWLWLSATENLRGYETPFQPLKVGASFAYRLSHPPLDGPLADASLSTAGSPSNRRTWTGRSFGSGALACSPLEMDAGLQPNVARRFSAPEERSVSGVVAGSTMYSAVQTAQPADHDTGPLLPARRLHTHPAPTPASPEDDYQVSTVLIERGDLVAARQKLDALVAAHPEHILARVTLGNLFLRTHDFEEAIVAYRQVQDRAPMLPEVHYLEGVVYRKLADFDRAAHPFRHALFLEADFWCASFMLAGVLGRLGKLKQRRLNLMHTLSILERNPSPRLFTSYVKGMKDIDLDPASVAALCKRYLHSEP